MDSFLMNKIFGGILGVWLLMLVFFYVIGFVIYVVYGFVEGEWVYVIEVMEIVVGGVVVLEVDFVVFLVNVDLGKGEWMLKKCL